ncbi:sigma-54-dependent transcriptional regulator [Desulforamulus hydrothermalis]|uniref:Stage 0 sporulation protein A homolog n=1 Tax=Desulforamulus hydrothermalis Lam5 = DSM 18033 TaxID=1121428 RepID=K8E158_9FIRM|nr:sigma-54 dependent transcriptional regulator [Desulforamulus hydrothermalis]CCO09467.1 putative DNA-binding response regulator in two-component system [Desulforamulus hydrothermalis Lam5 = DSM 18033]SHH07590.1 DNA-binding transcriptional response regulator, NtrC family, contains REC, AAA-type ATPase, and a Fis-type DNA-binding domains [Desulforamulus hydrothermalis Lam5 = DSM 18033]
MNKILIIDDEEHMCWALEKGLRQEGYHVLTTTRAREGLELIRKETPSLVILDLKMPELDGLEVLLRAKDLLPKLPVIMITAHGTIDTAIEAMKLGATDYITKPFDLDELKLVVKQALMVSQLQEEVSFLRSELNKKYGQIIGNSQVIQDVCALIEKVADSNATVLITGESGTGKEVTALSIHQLSSRRDKPFVPINCAALPESLLESELFGHEKGAFTGAVARKLGRFELANQGTLFLDEVTEMPLSMQVKLLRVLQEKQFERVGGTESIKVDVRVIAATNRDPVECIRKGTFREDLYYRLNVLPIHLPPLRERSEDIPLLVMHFLQKFNPSQEQLISPEAMTLLKAYQWPGNIRELQNVIERAVILSQGQEIKPRHLPKEIQKLDSDKGKAAQGLIINFPDDGISFEEVEKELIIKALAKSNGNQTRAAQLLGITRSALLYRAQKYQIKL